MTARFDGIFFDSGNTIFGFGQEPGAGPTAADIAAGKAARAAAALEWLGHRADEATVAQQLELCRKQGRGDAGWTEEVLVTRLFEAVEVP